EGCRLALPARGLHCQALRQPDGREGGLGRDPDARRLWLSRGFPAGAHLSRRPGLPDLRGHLGRAAHQHFPRTSWKAPGMNLGSDVAAVITGGASGLGLAVARALAREGVRTGILDMNESAGRAMAAE